MLINKKQNINQIVSASSVIAFIFIYALDPLFLLIENWFSNSPFQFGSAGILIGILSLVYFIWVKKNYQQWSILILVIILFFFLNLISISTSSSFKMFDTFLFLKMFAFISLGFWFSTAYSRGIMRFFQVRKKIFLCANICLLFFIVIMRLHIAIEWPPPPRCWRCGR